MKPRIKSLLHSSFFVSRNHNWLVWKRARESDDQNKTIGRPHQSMWVGRKYLNAVGQVAISVWEFRFQLQSSLVGLYCFGNVARVFVYRSEITMGVGESWIYLYGSRVTLKRSLHILHLLQRVAHVRISIRKGRLNSEIRIHKINITGKILKKACQVSKGGRSEEGILPVGIRSHQSRRS